MNKVKRAEMNMFKEVPRCVSGKPIYDKRGAVTAKNKRMRDEHVELREYSCPKCHGWHLTKQV